MNKEDYVSMEVAKLLEKKGFNEPCDSRHIVYDDGRYKFERYKTFDIQKDIGIAKIKDGCFYDSYLAPTLYDAQKWLREKHKIHIIITPHYFDGDYVYSYTIKTKSDLIMKEKGHSNGIHCEMFEQCLNDAILETLNLI